ncbi:DNA polymerase III subunit delta [Aquibacillus halophilus]|uniref:DNA polymerase III subunit delta n=1 Tax=Aquibacillus halophilus TaxID=930132 RepID=A0A6A8DBZ7_9BACI|nr:DNA polymerase III subunit delta [Aquibacillus halophilus]MRH43064.1 DNA polymerase III subunit delta [Aquibacillus halophilus]
MTYIDSLKKIKKKQFSPVYLLYGTESFLIQDLKKQLITYGLMEQDKDTNISSYDLEETPIQDVIADAETYPFFGERKVIFAHNPLFLKAKPDKVSFEHDLDLLQSYLNQPVDYSIIVFIAPYEKLDERKKVTKLLKKQSELIPCQPIKEWELGQWIKDMAKSSNVSIDEQANDALIQEMGSNLLMIQSEVEKMALYVGDGGKITKAVADELISSNPNSSGLKLVDAVIAADLGKAILIYKDLEKAKEEPIVLVALLASQFRTILHAKLLKQKGYSQNQMVQQLKAHPYVIKMSLTREKNFSATQLQTMLVLCTDTDAQIKQGRMDKNLAFELLLNQMIAIRKGKNEKQGIGAF